MQQENQTFSDRTDRLANALGIPVGSLPPKIGISRAMLFAYRSDKQEPSQKALLKLTNAERDAGILTVIDAKSPGALLQGLRDCIGQAQEAESLILSLKQSLESLLKKL